MDWGARGRGLYRIDERRDTMAGGAAALRFAGAAFAPAPAPVFGRRGNGQRRRVGDFELVVDLGQRIGSGEWFRGLLTCLGLCYAAWSLAPPLAPIDGVGEPPLADTQFEQLRVTGIAPLAYGADTGRRMAPTEAVVPLPEPPERPIVELSATLGRGDSLASALARAGVGRAEAGQVAAMIAEALPDGGVRAGTTLDLTLGRRPDRTVPRPLERLAFRARFDLSVEIERAGGALRLKRIPIAVDDTPLRIQGRVGASLYRSARAAGVPARIIQSYIRAIATQISVPSDLKADDQFDIIIEHRRAETGETETGGLLYAGLQRDRGRDLRLMQWSVGGASQWFDAAGVGRRTGGLLRPVPGRVTSGYGRRFHPILHLTRMHTGTDFHATYGQPIVAAADGRVVRAGRAGGYGNQVKLAHDGGLVTSYSHLSRFAVRTGERVHRGQVIGYAGATGLATGAHLHYEVFRGGHRVDPMSVRFSTRTQLSGRDLANFRDRLRGLLATPTGDRVLAAGGGGQRAVAR